MGNRGGPLARPLTGHNGRAGRHREGFQARATRLYVVSIENYDASTYGDRWAEIHDLVFQTRIDATHAVELLAELAGEGDALELGIGTGRIAVPLAERGVRLSGIDASKAMVEKMREKPGGESIPVTIGDFVELDVEGSYQLIYIANDTFFGIGTQAEQLACLRRVSALLEPGGHFVLDVYVPDPLQWNTGPFKQQQALTSWYVGCNTVVIDVSMHDPVTQAVDSSTVFFRMGDIGVYPVRARYCWPSELDMMALAAGLELEARYAWYDRTPFDADSRKHVSVYRKTPWTSGDNQREARRGVPAP